MNITFLLGNGFDIGLGLNTGYENFYKEYSQTLETDNATIQSFKKMLQAKDSNDQEKIIDWSDFEKAFGEYSNFFYTHEKQKYIDCFEDFVINFNEYLQREEKRADFSNTSPISKIMNTAVTTYYHIRPEDKEAIQLIINSADSYRKYNFISFNYTKTVDECARILKKQLINDSSRDVGDILHIHGYLDENMIMGVNDASQILKETFAKDKGIISEIVKPQQNSDMRTNYEKQVIATINSSNIICIYGMSIGLTDKKWWSYIAKWLAKSEKHALIILKYDKKCDKRFPFKHSKFIEDIIENFLTLSEQTEEIKNQIRSRIFVGMNHNIFTMPLCKEVKKDLTLIDRIEAADKTIINNNDYIASIVNGIEVAEKAQKIINQ